MIQVKWNADNQPSSLKINQNEVKWEDLHDRLQGIFARADRVAFVKGMVRLIGQVIDIARSSVVGDDGRIDLKMP